MPPGEQAVFWQHTIGGELCSCTKYKNSLATERCVPIEGRPKEPSSFRPRGQRYDERWPWTPEQQDFPQERPAPSSRLWKIEN